MKKRYKIAVFSSLILLSSMLSTAVYAAQCTVKSKKTYNNPTVNGMRIDRCVQGAGWGLLNPARCDKKRQRKAVNAYCRIKGYQSAASWRVTAHIGNHSIWTYPRGQSGNRGNWTQVAGTHAFSKIVCQKAVITNNCYDKKRFNNPTMRGMYIDRCVQGSGWGLFDPKRCDGTRQKKIANAYCKAKGYQNSTSHGINGHVGNHSIWTYSRGNSGNSGSWTQIAGTHKFSYINCRKRR